MPKVRVSTIALLAIAVLLAAVAILGSRDPNWVRRPVVRSERYATTIAEFTTSLFVPSQFDESYGGRVWKERVAFGAPPKDVIIIEADRFSVTSVDYLDGSEPVDVFEPADYTNIIEVRLKGSTLFVYRSVSLIWDEYRLAVFDLAARKPINDFLIAPEDMPSIPQR